AGSNGGGGAGGAVRMIASTLTGNGPINAVAGGSGGGGQQAGGAGSTGRIRLEADNFNRTAVTNPAAIVATTGPVFVAGSPTLAISSVAGVPAPANPTG